MPSHPVPFYSRLLPSRTGLLLTAVVIASCIVMAGFQIATMISLAPDYAQFKTQWLLNGALSSWLAWVLGAPLLVFIGMRYRPRARHWGRTTVAHAVTCCLLVSASCGYGYWLCAADPTASFSPFEIDPNQECSCAAEFKMFAINTEGWNPEKGPQPWDPTQGVPTQMVPGNWPEHLPVPDLSSMISPLDGANDPSVPFGLSSPPEGFTQQFTLFSEPEFVPFSLVSEIPVYVMFALIVQALLAFGELKDRKTAEARLRAELTQSQLSALRTQVKPHFLFNALNGVNALMASDVSKARSMLAGLSGILRASFEDLEQQEVSLSKELRLVEQYAEIQCVRFGDRMSLSIDVSPEARSACLPALSLQPLIENSVVHAVEKSTQPCEITVRAVREGDNLVVVVEDNGPGVANAEEWAPRPSGVGLSNTRERFAQLYGSRGNVESGPLSERGFRVTLTVPFHEECDSHGQPR